jgi:AraC-like DNA-binding protein
MHVGRLVVSKPEIEYVVRHIDDHPDLCTSFNFTDAFYEKVKDHFREEAKWFFSNPDLQSLLLTAHADIEFLHQRILAQATQQSSLELDDLVLQLVEKVMNTMGNKPRVEPLTESLKKHHLFTVEKARDFLFQNFSKDISLQQLADHCCVSLFHFSRIFKSIMNSSPHQYLAELRLSNAQLLLQSTMLSITEIAIQNGYNSLEHFTTAFKQRYKTSPNALRKGIVA